MRSELGFPACEGIEARFADVCPRPGLTDGSPVQSSGASTGAADVRDGVGGQRVKEKYSEPS
jgi:hypothetical protein